MNKSLFYTGIAFLFFTIMSIPTTAHAVLPDFLDFPLDVISAGSEKTSVKFEATQSFAAKAELANSTKDFIKEYKLDALASKLSIEILNNMSNRIILWANEGFVTEDGDRSPLFVGDFESLFRDIADDSVRQTLQSLQGADSPYIADTTRFIVRTYTELDQKGLNVNLGSFTQEAWANFQQDAYVALDTNDPWEAYRSLSYGSNTPIGALQQVSEQIIRSESQRALEETTKVISGGGFLPETECVSFRTNASFTTKIKRPDPENYMIVVDNQTINDGFGGQSVVPIYGIDQAKYNAALNAYTAGVEEEANSQGFYKQADGTYGKRECIRDAVLNPAGTVGNLVNEALNSQFAKIENADEWTELALQVVQKTIVGVTEGGIRYIGGQVSDNVLANIEANDPISLDEFSSTSNLGQRINDFSLETVDVSSAQDAVGENIDSIGQVIQNYAQAIDAYREFPQNIYTLDRLYPGPDKGWNERLSEEMSSGLEKLLRKSQGTNAKADEAEDSLNNIRDLFTEMLDIIAIEFENSQYSYNDPFNQNQETLITATSVLDWTDRTEDLANDQDGLENNLRSIRRELAKYRTIQNQFAGWLSLTDEQKTKTWFAYEDLFTTSSTATDIDASEEVLKEVNDELELVRNLQARLINYRNSDPVITRADEAQQYLCKVDQDMLNQDPDILNNYYAANGIFGPVSQGFVDDLINYTPLKFTALNWGARSAAFQIEFSSLDTILDRFPYDSTTGTPPENSFSRVTEIWLEIYSDDGISEFFSPGKSIINCNEWYEANKNDYRSQLTGAGYF